MGPMKEIEKNNEAYKALSLVSRRISELEADNERLCKQFEAENATLRTQLTYVTGVRVDELQAENDKLRELVRDMWRDGMCECDERGTCTECEYHFPNRMRMLGVEP